MRIVDITLSNNRRGELAYALVRLQSSMEAQSMLGEGEQDIFVKDRWVRIKPIAIGGESNSVCCRVIND